MPETYLGDGLYASFDGFQFILRVPRGLEGDHWVETARDALKKVMTENAELIRERDEARREAHAWSQNALKQVGAMRASENAFLNELYRRLGIIEGLAFELQPPNTVTAEIMQECIGLRDMINRRLATGNWPAEVFKPLPEEEAKLMRDYGEGWE